MEKLPDPRLMAPLKASPMDEIGNDWPVAWQTGNSGEDGQDWCIYSTQTDRVRASQLACLDFPSDAKSDAEAIVAIVNAYRLGRLVLKS